MCVYTCVTDVCVVVKSSGGYIWGIAVLVFLSVFGSFVLLPSCCLVEISICSFPSDPSSPSLPCSLISTVVGPHND